MGKGKDRWGWGGRCYVSVRALVSEGVGKERRVRTW